MRVAVALFATTITHITTACSGGGDQGTSDDALYKNPVTLTWWHNASQDGPARPTGRRSPTTSTPCTRPSPIEIEAIETNQLQRTRIPAALLSNDPPDIFQAWGGGEIVEQVEAGYLKDITDQTKTEVANIGSAAGIWQVDGKQYGLPFRMGIEGFWYNKDMFTQAGIAAPPTTFDELNAAVTKLKADQRHPDRRGCRRQVARRALVVQLRAAGLLGRRAQERPPPSRTSTTRASSRPART